MIKRVQKESILDPVQDKLNPKIWMYDNTMRPEVRNFLLNTVNSFGIKGINRIYMIGSNTGFQYTPTSDVDVHIYVPGIDKNEQELSRLKKLVPTNLKLPGTDAPVQFYAIGIDETKGFEGKGAMYDIQNDNWIVTPKMTDIKVPYSHLMNIARFFTSGIEDRLMELEADEKELEHLQKSNEPDAKAKVEEKKKKILEDIDALITADEVLYGYRSDAYSGKAFNTNVQMGVGNDSVQSAVFKIVEELGYRKKLKEGIAKREKYEK